MGVASSLFYSSDSSKETLHKRITPSEVQVNEQQERWHDLAEYLLTDLVDRSGTAIKYWLQGSYKFGTQIRPIKKDGSFDIDLGVYYLWPGEGEGGPFQPKEIKDFVQESLKDYDVDDKIKVVSPPKERCCRILFSGNFHIDLPVYHLDEDADLRELARENNTWEQSDPKKLYNWFKEKFSDSDRDKVRRHIRYFKCWASLKFRDEEGKPSSTLLTVLVSDAFDELNDDEKRNEDETLFFVVQKLINRLAIDHEIENPVDPEEKFGNRLTASQFANFQNKLNTMLETAEEALSSDSLLGAVGKWSEIFEHFFPFPEATEIEESASTNLPAVVSVPAPLVLISAISKKGGFKKAAYDEIGPIPRDCTIKFRVANPGVLPQGAEIEWVVRNEGVEAEYANDLGHFSARGLESEDERSEYNGVQYMDCVVKINGIVASIKRAKVTISGPPIPARNPRKRPSWVSLRKRRR